MLMVAADSNQGLTAPEPSEFVHCPVCGKDDARHEREVNGYRLVRCAACGMVFMNPQYTAEQIAELYENRETESLAAVYTRIGASTSVIAQYQDRLKLFEAILPGRGRLLDFACGPGYFFELAQARGWDAHGTELGRWAADMARARGLRNLHLGRLSDLNFPDASFDVIHAAQVLEHLANPIDELLHLRRILRPGGLLYVDVPNYQTLPIMLNRDDFMLNEPPQHVNFFRPRQLSLLLRSCGFVGARVFTGGGLKWENLIGAPIRSDRAAAYGLSGRKDEAKNGDPSVVNRTGWSRSFKKLVSRSFVQPILYDRLRVGMTLAATARRV